MDLITIDNAQLALEGVLALLGAATIVLRFVSKYTKSDADDKALGWLGKAQEWLLKLVVPKKLR